MVKFWLLVYVAWWVSLCVLAVSPAVTCHWRWLLTMYIEGSLVPLLSVQANKELVKDVLTCRPLESLVYKSRHPDDTDNPDTIGMSSEDEAEGMEDILGVSRRLNKPPPAEPLTPEPAAPEEEGMIKVPKKDLKRAHLVFWIFWQERRYVHPLEWHGKMFLSKFPRCRWVTPVVSCAISFKSTRSLRHHMKTHTGDTGWSCNQCGKVLASRVMHDLHMKGCGQEKGHWCQEAT